MATRTPTLFHEESGPRQILLASNGGNLEVARSAIRSMLCNLRSMAAPPKDAHPATGFYRLGVARRVYLGGVAAQGNWRYRSKARATAAWAAGWGPGARQMKHTATGPSAPVRGRRRSFCLSFHLALLGPTGADRLDSPPDLS
jgi:hypothetical protein